MSAAYLHNAQRRVRDGSLTAGQQHYVSEAVFQSAVRVRHRRWRTFQYHVFDSRRTVSAVPI